MYGLFKATHETADVSTLVDGKVFVDRRLSDQLIRAVPLLGMNHPAYSMSNGKSLLSLCTDAEIRTLYGNGDLQRLTPNTLSSLDLLLQQVNAIRNDAIAYDREEHALGTYAVGLPVEQFQGIKLAISVVLPPARFTEKRRDIEKVLVDYVMRCQRRLEALVS